MTAAEVIRRSGTSTGSFYARFGNRDGLIEAVQDRFLTQLTKANQALLDAASAAGGLPQSMGTIVSTTFETFASNRLAFIAFIIHGRSDPVMRQRGSLASHDAAMMIREVLERNQGDIRHIDLDVAAGVVFRTLFALAVLSIMFDQTEVTGRPIDQVRWTDEVTSMLLAYLRTPPDEPTLGAHPIQPLP